jgi:hypothetical protein
MLNASIANITNINTDMSRTVEVNEPDAIEYQFYINGA